MKRLVLSMDMPTTQRGSAALEERKVEAQSASEGRERGSDARSGPASESHAVLVLLLLLLATLPSIAVAAAASATVVAAAGG